MLTPIQNILLRVTDHTLDGMVSPKLSALSYTEEDNNFYLIYAALRELNSVGNVAPYDPGTTYSNSPPQYVSYNNQIWLYINASPAMGVTPSTANAAWWELESGNALQHAQNTDLYLGVGSPWQISAQNLFNLFNNQIISTSKATMDLMIAFNSGAGVLRPGYLYWIVERDIIVRAVAANKLAPECYIWARLADYQNVSTIISGEWNSSMLGGGVGVGTTWIYLNKHYTNTTGVVDAILTPDLDATNWTLIPTYDVSYQREIHRGMYDFQPANADSITERWDDKRRVHIKRSDILALAYKDIVNDYFYWGCDRYIGFEVIDMEFMLIDHTGSFNKTKLSFEISIDDGNSYLIMSGTGSITNCQIVDGFSTGIVGDPSDMVNLTTTWTNTKLNYGNLKALQAKTLLNNEANLQYSNIQDTLSITGGGLINLVPGASNVGWWAGILELTSANPTETITNYNPCYPQARPVRFITRQNIVFPVITFDATAGNLRIRNSTNFVLSNPADWIIIHDHLVNGAQTEQNSFNI